MVRIILVKDSKYTTPEYDRLLSEPFKKTPIRKLREGELASEYNSWIADYSTEKLSVQNRFMTPYITSENHGDVYSRYRVLLENIKPKSILDLGCGAGELLAVSRQVLPDAALFGVTIHYGEVLEAKEKYNLDIAPADMRDIDRYFTPNSLDLIVVHCSFNFLVEEERVEVSKKAQEILKVGKHYLVVDYQHKKEESGLNSEVDGLIKKAELDGFMGTASLYEKRY